MNKELIEKLKDKSQATNYILRTKEEQEILYKAKLKGCALVLIITQVGPEWITAGSYSTKRLLETLILNPDYQPEPKYVDIEIVQSSYKSLCVKGYPLDGRTSIHKLPCRPDFDKFYSDICKRISLTDVAGAYRTAQERGHKVYARLRPSTPVS